MVFAPDVEAYNGQPITYDQTSGNCTLTCHGVAHDGTNDLVPAGLLRSVGFAEPLAVGHAEPLAVGHAEPVAEPVAEPRAVGHAEPRAEPRAESVAVTPSPAPSPAPSPSPSDTPSPSPSASPSPSPSDYAEPVAVGHAEPVAVGHAGPLAPVSSDTRGTRRHPPSGPAGSRPKCAARQIVGRASRPDNLLRCQTVVPHGTDEGNQFMVTMPARGIDPACVPGGRA